MSDLINLVYVEGNLLLTFVHLCILFFSFDFLISFAGLIKSIKGGVS